METKVIATSKAPAAIGPYSQGITVGDFVFTSGQIPVDPATGNIPEGITAQAEQSCRNVAAVLAAAGSDATRVIKTTCFLADMGDFAAFNAVYAEYFTSKPARSCVAVKILPKNVLVEVEVIAKIWYSLLQKEFSTLTSIRNITNQIKGFQCYHKSYRLSWGKKRDIFEDGLEIVDQHIADERYIYEKLKKSKNIDCQLLFISDVIELSSSDCDLLEMNQEKLAKYGYEIDFSIGNIEYEYDIDYFCIQSYPVH